MIRFLKSFFYFYIILFNMGMHLKNKRKRFKKIRLVIILTLIGVISIFSCLTTNYVSHYYLNYSTWQAKKIIDNASDRGVNDEVLSLLENLSLYNISKNKNNEIEMIDYNPYALNIFLKKVSKSVSESLLEEEKNDASFYIPMGVFFRNPLLNNKGPKIPVKLELVGVVLSSLYTKVTEYGINNCLIEISVRLEIEEKVILPISTDIVKIVNDVPISYKIINGKIPTYYGDNITKTSSVYKLPVE